MSTVLLDDGLLGGRRQLSFISAYPEHIIIIYVTCHQTILPPSKQPKKKKIQRSSAEVFICCRIRDGHLSTSVHLGCACPHVRVGRLLADLSCPWLEQPGRLCSMFLIFQSSSLGMFSWRWLRLKREQASLVSQYFLSSACILSC